MVCTNGLGKVSKTDETASVTSSVTHVLLLKLIEAKSMMSRDDDQRILTRSKEWKLIEVLLLLLLLIIVIIIIRTSPYHVGI